MCVSVCVCVWGGGGGGSSVYAKIEPARPKNNEILEINVLQKFPRMLFMWTKAATE